MYLQSLFYVLCTYVFIDFVIKYKFVLFNLIWFCDLIVLGNFPKFCILHCLFNVRKIFYLLTYLFTHVWLCIMAQSMTSNHKEELPLLHSFKTLLMNYIPTVPFCLNLPNNRTISCLLHLYFIWKLLHFQHLLMINNKNKLSYYTQTYNHDLS